MKIERHTDAVRLNEIVNSPEVYPHVRGYQPGPIDLSPQAADENNYILVGEQGALVFQRHTFGLFEVHSQCLVDGRGRWMLEFTQACLSWMFTRTEAMEVVTRCPKGNLAALALAKRVGMRYTFTNPQGWVKDLDPIPADILWLSVHDWLQGAPGLEARGDWARARIDNDFRRHGFTKEWPKIPTLSRYMGAAVEMISHGQVDKGVVLFNRWAVMADCLPLDLVSRTPPTIDTGDALVIVQDEDCWVATIKTAGLSKAA